MRPGFRRGLAIGTAYGLIAALVAEAVRPRGGSASLLDWDEVARIAMARTADERMDPAELASTAATYNRFAAELRGPLLDAVGGLPPGAQLPAFEALDRARWLELNVGILRRLMEPLADVTRVPNSWLAGLGRSGVDRYVALVLEFLSRRVLGQFDPQLLGREPVRPPSGPDGPPPPASGGGNLYLVEPNVAAWERRADLPGEDLRRWLILHELAHAWQFAGHPWLREHLDAQLEELIGLTKARHATRGMDRLRALTIGAPAQWDVLRRLQATMSVIEGYGNLVMNLVGGKVLSSMDRLEAAYRQRSGERNVLEVLTWRLTGLELKLEQYRVGERFVGEIRNRYGMDVLNRVWDGPESLPRGDELRDPERWVRRVVRKTPNR
jgi:coenzyme F420 biosynthesis associated uncharacterized protein